jgi:hypothetical protein
MTDTADISRTRRLRRSVLALLSDLYLFPQTDRLIAGALRDDTPGLTVETVRSALAYLSKKGYVDAPHSGPALVARITAAGVDVAEGAVVDRGILAARPSFSGLSFKRQARRWILAYCAQFPNAWNADDEIHAEFAERGGGPMTLEQVRVGVWYLAGKGYVEMRTQPVAGEIAYLSRITAEGIDLVEGVDADPGVADER